ncbi:MAG: hypothetical protein R3Y59_10450 [bacterium]
MLRTSKITAYEIEVRESLQELYDKCKINMMHSGDLLLCEQNGFLFNGKPCVGLGDEGINNIEKINTISYNGIGETTDDDNYFLNCSSNFHTGSNELSNTIRKEKSTYLDIWENTFYLSKLTQIANTLNGVAYDWNLDISHLPPSGKSKHIREQIIQRLNLAPKIQSVIRSSYIGQIRNAIAHSQYNCIKGGIIYNNYNRNQYSKLQGLSFEQWEEKYIKTYIVFVGVFGLLKQVTTEYYLPLTSSTLGHGIPIRVPDGNGAFKETHLLPSQDGSIWRFTNVL